MLTVSVNDFDPYEMARNILKLPDNEKKEGLTRIKDIKVDIESGRVTFYKGELSNGILNFIGIRPVTAVTNASPKEVRIPEATSENLIGIPTANGKITTDVFSTVKLDSESKTKSDKSVGVSKVTSFRENDFGRKPDNKTSSVKPAKMSLWMVDFGTPVGGEFGYEHPAILCEETSKGLWNVLPCTTKLWDEKEVLELCFADRNVLKNKNPKFFAKPISNVLIKEQQSVSEQRFLEYLGDIGEDYHELIERCYKRGKLGADISFKLEDLNFSEKQIKLLDGNEEEMVKIGNDFSITYDEKIKKILNLLGFFPDADEGATYLVEALTRTKVSRDVNGKKLFTDISRRKIVSAEYIQNKVTLLLKKKYKDLYPCFELFLRTINRIAYYR